MKRVPIPRKFFEKILLLLTLFTVVILYVVLDRTEIVENFFPTNTIVSSSQKGIPFINDNEEIAIYSVTKKSATSTKLKAINSGIFSGNGGSSIKASPDFTYSAVIDAQGHDLWLISNETLKKYKITKKDEVAGRIIAWSPKGDKFLYELDFNAKIGIGGNDFGNIVTSKPRKNNSGMYIFDIRSRKVTKLPRIIYYVKFLGDTIIFRKPDENGGPGNQLYELSTKTFLVKTMPNDTSYQNEVDQYDISTDKKKWTFLDYYTNHIGSDSQIVYADYPKKDGTVVFEGKWAEAQWPRLSPDSKKVLYERRLNSVDSTINDITVFDTSTKTKKTIMQATEAIWFDDTHILTLNTAVLLGSEYNLVNIETGKKEKIQ